MKTLVIYDSAVVLAGGDMIKASLLSYIANWPPNYAPRHAVQNVAEFWKAEPAEVEGKMKELVAAGLVCAQPSLFDNNLEYYLPYEDI